jgi:Ser/Thr protein kinase RdoA (MazF antagonist)
VAQIQSGSISCVLRAPTAAGDVYLKAVPPLFGAEPRIARALAARHPRHTPPVLATDRTRRWTLLGDAGAPLRRCADPAVWERVLRRHAEQQRAWVGQEAALLAMGCPDRRLPLFAAELDALAGALAAGRGGADEPGADEPGADVPAATVAALRAALPRLRRLCADLDAAGPPATLVHGDLHGGNVAWKEGEPVFFDWTDACLAHPFLDLATVLRDDPAAPLAPHYPRLRDAYLEPWTDGATTGHLRRAFEQALTLGSLFQAVSYFRIVSSLEPAARREWSGALPAWLRRGLARLDAPLQAPDRPGP